MSHILYHLDLTSVLFFFTNVSLYYAHIFINFMYNYYNLFKSVLSFQFAGILLPYQIYALIISFRFYSFLNLQHFFIASNSATKKISSLVISHQICLITFLDYSRLIWVRIIFLENVKGRFHFWKYFVHLSRWFFFFNFVKI